MADLSIMNSIKKLLGIEEGTIAFDEEIRTHINSAFFTLNQLGVGPKDGFSIEDDTVTWTSFFIDRKDLESVKTYIYFKVRLIFDPPQMGYLVEALKEQIKELEWRLIVQTTV